jgi:CRISPR/Cas system CSM-associated protein Csm5 (group 7 of RAMP superfamily)
MDFTIETLTPVNIGNGEVLSQFSDYVYEDGFIYYLGHNLLLKEISKKPNSEEIIDKFVFIVQNQAKGNLKNRFNLRDFFKEIELDYKEYAMRRIAVGTEIKEQIRLHIKSSGQPYIPGSSLKGAIRTALISFFFKDSKEIINKKKYIGEDIFGSFGRDKLKYLFVSDTPPFAEENLGIAKFYKFNIKSGEKDIPVVKEVITGGASNSFAIKTTAQKNDVQKKFDFLHEGNEVLLLEVINDYAKKNIEIELQQLQRCNSDEINEIKDFYSSLLTSVEATDSKSEAYLRIGAGKTYYDNTVAQKMSKETIRLLITRNFKKADINFFPVTRTIAVERDRKGVPGWVRISKKEA